MGTKDEQLPIRTGLGTAAMDNSTSPPPPQQREEWTTESVTITSSTNPHVCVPAGHVWLWSGAIPDSAFCACGRVRWNPDELCHTRLTCPNFPVSVVCPKSWSLNQCEQCCRNNDSHSGAVADIGGKPYAGPDEPLDFEPEDYPLH